MTAIYPYRNPRVQLDLPQPDPETRLVLNHETNRYVRIGLREYEWLQQLNGQVASQDIAALFERDAAFVEELLRRMASAKLICLSDQPVEVRDIDPKREPVPAVRRFEWTQFGQMRFHVGRLHGVFERIARFRWLMSKPFVALTAAISIFGFAMGVRIMQIADLQKLMQAYTWHAWDIAVIIGLIFLNTAIHEMGHGVVCTYFGIPVRGVGVMVFYLQPAAYVDVTDAWRLKNKWHRVAISFAGIYVQAAVTSFACLIWLVLRANHHSNNLLIMFIGLNLSLIVFNLLPFVKLDGYWILSNIVGVPNLLDRAMEWWRALALSALTRRAIDARRLRYNAVLAMTPLGRSLLACFGWTATVFSASMWLGGLAFLFRVAGWLKMPRGLSYLSVAGLVLGIAAWFVTRLVLARSKAKRQAMDTNAPTAALPPRVISANRAFVTYNIDRHRPIRLNPFTTTVRNSDGTLIFAWSTPDQLSVQNAGKLAQMIPALRHGAVTLEDLEQHGNLNAAVLETIQRLWHLKHLRYASEWESLEGDARYSRQLGWLSMNAAARGSEADVLERLKSKSVTVLGVGGVGTHVAWNLAACGVGELHLVDGDKVEMSNLNRQLFYTPADVGRAKVEVTAERLTQFNPQLKVRTTKAYLKGVSDIAHVIRGADFVVRSLDSPLEIMTWVNEACLAAGVPSLGGGFFAQGAMVGPTVIPGETACLACNAVSSLPAVDRGIGGTFAPVVTICAGLISGDVVTYLGKLGKVRTAGAIMLIDAPAFAINVNTISRNNECRVCGGTTAVGSTRKAVSA